MKKINFISIALLGAYALLTAACVKEIVSNDELYRPKGSPIVFSASTGYDNGPVTRAVYSGEIFGTTDLFLNSNSWERIDWEEDDPVRIFYNTSVDNYLVAAVGTPSNEISKAELSGGGLQWGDSGSHLFYGLYPSGQNGGGIINSSGQVTGFIPKTQNVNSSLMLTGISEEVGSKTYTYDKYQPNTREYGYLVAREIVDANSTATSVTLRFKPAFTTFEFKFNRTGNVYKTLKSATLATESVNGADPLPLAGTFQIKLTGTDQKGATWNTETTGTDPTVISGSQSFPLSNSITVGFGNDGVEIPEGNSYLDFSILCLPIELKGLKLTLTFDGGVQKVLRFKDNNKEGKPWYTFAAAKKYVITNVSPSGDWIYVLEEIDDIVKYGHNAVSNIPFNVISYKYSSDNPDYKVEVPWHIEYSKDGSSYGTNASTYNNPDFMLSGLPDSATGSGSYTTGEARASNIIRPSEGTTTDRPAEDVSRDILSHRPPKGTSAPYDLSMYDIHGNTHAQTTANSYVVSAPGWYKFPVVYGNAITNGADNKSAYDPYAAGAPLASHWNWVWNDASGPDKTNHDVYMTEHFLNAKNEPISSPYVLVDVSASDPNAVLIWQDTTVGDEIIKYVSTDLQLVGSGSSAYIQFYIAPENIHQGNIVLAVRDGSNDDVLWSWHIWVCEKDLNPITSRNLMPYNLGWVDQEGLKETVYPDRVNYYRIVQDEISQTGDYLREPFSITQIGDNSAVPNNTGYNTFYQWGRKDPMASANAKLTSQDYASQLSASPVTSLHQFPNTTPLADNHSPSYSYGIKYPWIPTHDPDNNGWVNGQFYPPHEQFWHTDFNRGGAPNPDAPDVNPVDGVPDNYPNGDGVPHNGAQYRQLSGCPFNLWNAYAYSSDDFSGSEKKYKTVYDPCPPGFCVPTLGTFAGIESATLERDPDKGINFIFGNGDAFFLPFSGTRGTRQTTSGLQYIVNDRPERGVYWVDAPSNVTKSKYYVNGKWYRRDPVTQQLVENNANAQHGLGFWWFQFAKSLHLYNSIGTFPDEEAHSLLVKYTPEDAHWDTLNPAHSVGTYKQTQRTGFDDVRSNAFSIRPIVDPRY